VNFPLTCRDWNAAARLAAVLRRRGAVFIVTSNPPPQGSTGILDVILPDGAKLQFQTEAQLVFSLADAAEVPGRRPGVDLRLSGGQDALVDQLDASAIAHGATTGGEVMATPQQPTQSFAVETSPPMASTPNVAVPTNISDVRHGFVRPRGTVAGIAGIDFGTTFSSISVAIGERVHIIPDEEGVHLQPSVVHYPEGARPIVGEVARMLQLRQPRRTISSPKRLLGRAYNEQALSGYLHSLPYGVEAGPGGSIVVQGVDEEPIPIARVCSEVIRHLCAIAERQVGMQVKKAVLSAPVTFGEPQQAALRLAAKMAGVEVVEMIQEPAAGAIAYGAGQQKRETVAVYDFGGGTFDVTVLEIVEDVYRVLGAGGDAWLGGDDFDLALANAVADQFWKETRCDVRRTAVEWQRLLRACEESKRVLSVTPATRVSVPRILERPHAVDLNYTVNRTMLRKLCEPFFERSLEVCQEAFKQAGIEPTAVHQVIATGGVCHTPFVLEGLGGYFQREIKLVVNPDDAICFGAGLVAAKLDKHSVTGIATRN